MSDIAIRVENLSKKYTLHHLQPKGHGLRHVLEDTVNGPLRALKDWINRRAENRSHPDSVAPQVDEGSTLPADEEFWALRDVTFDIKCGEVVGIIGRNGAGKSTLLKVLSRITEPTTGRIEIEGRVASLLEVGTGFHPELTGRENIYLNGAILGMARAEIRGKFDEIVSFAEVERFLDTPVKRYSSGMYVRLAFAVAAHMEPEILIVDEVLAVGDAAFQKKCLGKMNEVASREGRTVLFVSHTMTAVRQMCATGLLLANGQLQTSGTAEHVISAYQDSLEDDSTVSSKRGGTGEVRISRVTVHAEEQTPHETRTITIDYKFTVDPRGLSPCFLILEIRNDDNQVVARCDGRLIGTYLKASISALAVVMKSPWLKPGRYHVRAIIDTGHGFFDDIECGATFRVEAAWKHVGSVHPDVYSTASVISDFDIIER